MPSPGLNYLQPITFSYEHDTDLNINQSTFATQQGLQLNLVNALSACNDAVMLNYSNVFLTNLIKANDFATVNLLQPYSLNFPTYLALSAYPSYNGYTRYVTLSSNYNSSYSPLTFSTSVSNQDITYFTFADIDGIRCFINNIDGGGSKNLTVDTNSLSCYFATTVGAITANSTFNYSLDRNGYLKLFFNNNGNTYVLRMVGNVLSAVNVSLYPSTTADIIATTFIQRPNNNFVNNFVYYTKPDPSDFNVDQSRDIADLAQNHIIHYNYESNINLLSSANVKVDFFKAKNFLTDGYTINDKMPFSSPVTQRKYSSITSRQNSEKYNGNLQFSYNYFTQNYTLKPDKVTMITMPATLYPYTVMNIDDSSLANNGAYGAQSPVFADKIYKQLNGNTNAVNYNEQNGSYLYSWLYTSTSELTSYWLDRFYYPKKTSLSIAYSGTPNQIFNYTSALSSYLSGKNIANNFYYYDIRSSLTLEPSANYYYSRIGTNYINKVLNGLPIYSNTFTHYISGTYSTDLVNSIAFNGTNYGSLVIPNTGVSNSFTASFNLEAESLSSINCNVLFGNNFDEGITLYKGGLTNIYTPGFFLTTPDTLNFYDKNFNETFSLTLSSYINAPYHIVDVINYGFDHLIKVLYFNYQTNNPGFLDISLTGKVHSVVEFPSLNGKLSNGAIGKVYVGNSQIAYTFYALVPSATLRTVTFDYINNTIVSVVDTYVGPNGWGSQVNYNNNIINLSGFKGVVVGNYGVSKNSNFIYYKNLSTNSEYISLSANNDYFFDILSYNNNLYIQTLNTISVFDQYKRSLGTFSVNTSAISGFKLDIINDNYQPKLLSFFQTANNTIGIAKYDINSMQFESSSATSLSAYTSFYQELLYPFSPQTYTSAPFVTPTNFSAINQVNGFSTGDVVVRADLFSGNDYQRKTVANFSANLLQNIKQNVSLVFDSPNGIISLYNNGVLLNTALLSSGNLQGFGTSHYLNNNFGIGTPYIDNNSAVDIALFDYPTNLLISNFVVYANNLNEDEIKFAYLSGGKIDAVTFDVPCGTRNNTDTVTSYNRFSIPGRKNNSVKIYIKNLNLNAAQQQQMTQIVLQKLYAISPANTNNFDIIYLDNEWYIKICIHNWQCLCFDR